MGRHAGMLPQHIAEPAGEGQRQVRVRTNLQGRSRRQAVEQAASSVRLPQCLLRRLLPFLRDSPSSFDSLKSETVLLVRGLNNETHGRACAQATLYFKGVAGSLRLAQALHSLWSSSSGHGEL